MNLNIFIYFLFFYFLFLFLFSYNNTIILLISFLLFLLFLYNITDDFIIIFFLFFFIFFGIFFYKFEIKFNLFLKKNKLNFLYKYYLNFFYKFVINIKEFIKKIFKLDYKTFNFILFNNKVNNFIFEKLKIKEEKILIFNILIFFLNNLIKNYNNESN